jgi:hypothetical protein
MNPCAPCSPRVGEMRPVEMGDGGDLKRAVRECDYAMPEGYRLKQLDNRGLWWAWVNGGQAGPDRLSPGPAVFDAWAHAQAAALADRDALIAKLQAEVDRLHQPGAMVTPTLEVRSRGGW